MSHERETPFIHCVFEVCARRHDSWPNAPCAFAERNQPMKVDGHRGDCNYSEKVDEDRQFCPRIPLWTSRTCCSQLAFRHVKQVPSFARASTRMAWVWLRVVPVARRRAGAFMVVAISRRNRQRHIAPLVEWGGRVILLRGIRKWPSRNGNFEPKPASAPE